MPSLRCLSSSGAVRPVRLVGFAALDHTSLDVSADGRWLLYLAGNYLYVSPGGAGRTG